MGRDNRFVLDRWVGVRVKVLLADIDQLYGKGKRSAFLTEIAEREVRKQKLLRALDAAAGCWRDEDHPELKNGAYAWVRELRDQWNTRLPKDS